MPQPNHILVMEGKLKQAVVAIRQRVEGSRDQQVLDGFLPLISHTLDPATAECRLPGGLNRPGQTPIGVVVGYITKAVKMLWQYEATGKQPETFALLVGRLQAIGLHGFAAYRVVGSPRAGYRLIRRAK
jgi:hypothetical protein